MFLGSKITADGDCSHEIKRCLLLGRKAMTNLDSILKSRDRTLPAKVLLVKAMAFPVVMCGCESWTIKKAECWRIDALNCGVGEDSWEYLELQDQISHNTSVELKPFGITSGAPKSSSIVVLYVLAQYFVNKGLSTQSYGFSSGHVWMWELDHKGGWSLNNWCFEL